MNKILRKIIYIFSILFIHEPPYLVLYSDTVKL